MTMNLCSPERDSDLVRLSSDLAFVEGFACIGSWTYDAASQTFRFGNQTELGGWRGDCSLAESLQCLPAEERAAFARWLGGALNGEALVLSHGLWNSAESCWMSVRSSAYPLRNAQGQCSALRGFTQDMTQIQTSEDTLRRYRALLASSDRLGHMCYWILDYATGVYEASESFCQLLGWPEGVTHLPEADFSSRIHPDDLPRLIAARRATTRDDHLTEVEYRFWKATEQRWINVRSILFFTRNPQGKPVMMYGFTQDITQHKESEAALQRERLRLESAQSLGRMGTWSFDLRSRIAHISRNALQMVGLPGEAEANLTADESLEDVHPDDRQAILQAIDQTCRTHEPLEIEYRCWHKTEQRWLTLRSAARLVFGADGRPLELQGFTQDITRQKESEERLRLAASVYDSSRTPMLITDIDRNIVQANRAFCEHTGFTEQEVIGQKPLALLNNELPADAMRIDIWQPLMREGHWSGEITGRRKDGSQMIISAGISTVCNEQGQIEHFICVGEDVTRARAAEEQIRQLAYYDPLTSLPNRVLLKERVDQAISHVHRAGQETALLFLDLDYFKRVNDSLGHSVGDLLLVEVAGRLRACVRAADTVGRLGGDEFLLLLPNAGPQAACRVAEKLIEALSQPFLLGGYSLTVTPTIGISLYPKDGADYDDLLRAADAAMYKAKDDGRNTFRLFNPEMSEASLQRLMLSNDLRRALKNGELQLHYQPQLSLPGGRVIGAEALMRWKHPIYGLVSPLKFIPVAEESGLIEAIGAWAIEEACRQAMAWAAQGLPLLTISVNCSARQFVAPESLLDAVCKALAQTGLPPDKLELEITETVIVKDIGKTQWLLDQFRTLGVKVAIDDFGTGYSSLYYLKRLPIDKLKIDQSFVRDLVQNADDRAIAATVVALGHTLGLKVIAEGVETPEQLQALEAMQCDEGQGYYWGMPMPPGEFVRWAKGISKP